MIPTYKQLLQLPEQTEKLIGILKKNIYKDQHARYTAVKYATRLFHFSNVESRIICLVVSSDVKVEVREEARRGLEFPENDVLNPTGFSEILPKFNEMVLKLDEEVLNHLSKQSIPGAQFVGNVEVGIFNNILCFLRSLLVKSCSSGQIVDTFASVSDYPKFEGETRRKIKELLKEYSEPMHESHEGLEGYIRWIETGISTQVSDMVQAISSAFLLELVSYGPVELTLAYSQKLSYLKSFLFTRKSETRICMAHVVGIVATSKLENDERQKEFLALLKELVLCAKDENKNVFDARHGAIVGLGFLIGRCIYRHPSNYTDYIPATLLEEAIVLIHAALRGHAMLVLGSIQSIAELGRYGVLPKGALSGSEISLVTVQESLQALVKTSTEMKIQEAALVSIGQLCVGNYHLVPKSLEFFKTLPTTLSKNVELQFNVGESICSSLFGFESSLLEEYLDVAECSVAASSLRPSNDLISTAFVDSVFELAAPQQSTVTRKAACIWLLCIVKFCGQSKVIKERMLTIHSCFSSLIADRDEFTQEIASKGIGLVYDMGDKEVKDELVNGLVTTLTEGRKIASQTIAGDTQLFAGSIGTTPDGSNISTYQSVLSLAADMNQPDLVYKFMSLASHHQIWNSRRGASMGFSSIAKQAEQELAPHLPVLIPRLYRYQFDPNPKTAESMKNIWRTLVKDPSKTVDSLFNEIMTDLLASLGDRMWRTREASCNALNDLMHGRTMEQLEPFIQQLWEMSFRALDDIKESVRKAAFMSCKTLTNTTVRYCDPISHPIKGQRVMDTIIPFLLNKGIGSMSEEVRAFSLATILKLCKIGGKLLVPHLSDLDITMLESLSSLEPQMMNYLSFHTDKYNITQDQLDSSRLSAAKASPILESIESTVIYITPSVLEALIPRLCVLIRKGIGLPTRAGCARFVYTLTARIPLDFKPFADAVLVALTHAINDPSPVIRKSFATALAHVAPHCTDLALDSFMNKLKSQDRSISCVTVLEMSRKSPELMRNYHAIILPLSFIGQHDATDAQVAKLWLNVWEENTTSPTSSIRQWSNELLDECEAGLNSSSWTMKAQVGHAISAIAKAQTNSVSRIILLLTEALSGRTFDGKEHLLEALMNLAVSSPEQLIDSKNAVENIFIRESKKIKRGYRRLAIEFMGKAFSALKSERWDDVGSYLLQVAIEDDEEEEGGKPMNLAIQANAFKCIGSVYPTKRQNQTGLNELCIELADYLKGHVWSIRASLLETLTVIFSKIDGEALDPLTLQKLLEGIMSNVGDAKVIII